MLGMLGQVENHPSLNFDTLLETTRITESTWWADRKWSVSTLLAHQSQLLSERKVVC